MLEAARRAIEAIKSANERAILAQEAAKRQLEYKHSPSYWKPHEAEDTCEPMEEPNQIPFSQLTTFEGIANKAMLQFRYADFRGRVEARPRSGGEEVPLSSLVDGAVVQFVKEEFDFPTERYRADVYWGVMYTDPNNTDRVMIYKGELDTRWMIARNPVITVGAIRHAKTQDGRNYAEKITELSTFTIHSRRVASRSSSLSMGLPGLLPGSSSV